MPAILYKYAMNRNHLALFHVVAQAGGISRGAEAARVSQPAVSKQIAELEDALGVRLLERLPRGCRLTEAGKILADYAQRWRSLENDAARAIEEYRGLKRGRLAIGASLTIGGYLLPGVLAEFHRRFPEIELQIEMANTGHIQKALLAGTIELGMTEGPVESEELESTVFFKDELVAIAPAGHPLLKKRRVTVREICREPFILREEGSGTRGGGGAGLAPAWPQDQAAAVARQPGSNQESGRRRSRHRHCVATDCRLGIAGRLFEHHPA